MNGKPQHVIERLTRAGYRVEVHHLRMTEYQVETTNAAIEDRRPWYKIRTDKTDALKRMSCRGGETIVTISAPSGPPSVPMVARETPYAPVIKRTASCSTYDNFNRSIGLRIALGRAIHDSAELRAALQLAPESKHQGWHE